MKIIIKFCDLDSFWKGIVNDSDYFYSEKDFEDVKKYVAEPYHDKFKGTVKESDGTISYIFTQ